MCLCVCVCACVFVCVFARVFHCVQETETKDYKLWVWWAKEASPYPLIGEYHRPSSIVVVVIVVFFHMFFTAARNTESTCDFQASQQLPRRLPDPPYFAPSLQDRRLKFFTLLHYVLVDWRTANTITGKCSGPLKVCVNKLI